MLLNFAALAAIAVGIAMKHYPHMAEIFGTTYTHSTLPLSTLVIVVAIAALVYSFTVRTLINTLGNPVSTDQKFRNGFSFVLFFKIFGCGGNYTSLCKYLSETCRKRLVTKWSRYGFFGPEHWICGHPAIVKQIFGPANMNKWSRADYYETQAFFYLKPAKPEKHAMLYTGDDARWRNTRHILTPFFYNTDFSKIDSLMDDVCKKHLQKGVDEDKGNIELLNFTFRSTLDLVLRTLYSVELKDRDFECLAKCMCHFIVPTSSGEFLFDGEKYNVFDYHMEKGSEFAESAKDGTVGQLLRDSDLPPEVKSANLGFFLEALTPAFASFWVIAHILTDKTGEQKSRCKEDPVFRQQCIKEALRMYPPVPVLWPRIAKKDMVMPNPIYDPNSIPEPQSFLSKLCFGERVENQPKLTIKKGTNILVVPSLMHYDSRFWFRPKEFLPDRWDNDPFVLEYKGGGEDGNSKKGTVNTAAKVRMRNTMTYGAVTEDSQGLLSRGGQRGAIEFCQTFMDTQMEKDSNIRTWMFGNKTEEYHNQANIDLFSESTDETFFDLQQYSFLPFAQGSHACLGRRLALHMVDSIVWNFLEYDGKFFSGIVPSLVVSKPWFERTNATAVVYNAPADPVYVTVRKPMDGKKSMRFSMIGDGSSKIVKSSKSSTPDSFKTNNGAKSSKESRPKMSKTKSVRFRDSGQYQDSHSASEQKDEMYSEFLPIDPHFSSGSEDAENVQEVHNSSGNKKYFEHSESDLSNHHDPSAPRDGNLRRQILQRMSVLGDSSFQFPSFEKTSDVRALITNVISGNFIFEGLGTETLSKLVDAFEHCEVEKDEIIIKEGDKGDFFYIIEQGTVEFSKMIKDSMRVVGRAGKSQAFGDLALLHDYPRAASCIALEACHLWRVGQDIFRQVLAKQRQSKDDEIIKILRKVKLFSNFTNDELGKVASIATFKNFTKDEYIIKKGELGREFYMVKEGTVIVRNIVVGNASYEDQKLSKGDYFGERALLTSEPRVADVVADENCIILCLTRKQFIDSVGSIEDSVKRMSDFRVLNSIPYFAKRNITEMQCEDLASQIEEIDFPSGADIFKENDETGAGIYLVRSGRVQSLSKLNNSKKEASSGGYFGLSSTVLENKCSATATAITDTSVGYLSKHDLLEVIGDFSRFKTNSEDTKAETARIPLESLTKHRILGIGTFGEVRLVSSIKNGRTVSYALKIQRKRHLLAVNQAKAVIREVEIMKKLDHPFLLKMVNLYHDSSSVMILLNLVEGGELHALMQMHRNGILPMHYSKFYAACILEGLHYMHTHSIVYRDLKPENVLIGKDGYAVIVDFGFARVVERKAFTMCGTPWYIAPEVILGRGHDKACDYWSWGILVHEMCTGVNPFEKYGNDEMMLFKAIVKGKYKISENASAHEASLVVSLLQSSSPEKRLGNLAKGIMDIKTHPWMKDIDFLKLSKKTYRAPWKPDVNDPLDTNHFEDIEGDEYDDKPLNAEEQESFSRLDSITM